MKPPSTARTAGRSGGCGGACDASPLSCFLFRPRKSREKRRKRSHTNVSNASVIWASRIFQAPLQTPLPCFHASINEYYTAKNGLGTIVPRLLSQVKVGTHLGSLRKIAHSGSQGETGAVSDGGAITPLGAFRTFTNIPGPGIRTASFAAFGSWSETLPKNAESLGTAMRSCVSLSRGVAAPLGCVICLQLGDVAVFSLCAQYFLNVRGGGGITTLGAFHTVRKPCVARG